jgi:DNA-binding transcriptional ArsR family regulator
MKAKERARYEARAKIMKALAHPARLLIVDILHQHGERCVCDLTDAVGSDMSTVSRHLSQLREAGIVQDTKRGQMVFYRLRVKCLTSLFNCIESVVQCNVNYQLQVLSE